MAASFDELFEMRSGYVLNFSDRTMSRFFAEELNVDIDDPTYAVHGGSKGKRLRCFLQKFDTPAVVKTLKALWEYREAIRMRDGKPERAQVLHQRPGQTGCNGLDGFLQSRRTQE